MTTRSMVYCVDVVKHDGTSAMVRMFLDTSQIDMQWTNVSECSGVSSWDSFFLNSLIVNPSVFLENDVPEEWSRVVLLALYRGSDGNEQMNENKSIWYSTLNTTAFAIVSPTVRTAALNHIQSLHLRASKSQLIIGSKEQRGILLVKTEVVQFEPLRKCETMVKFLSMADKVHTFFIKSYSILWLTSFFYRTVVGKKINPISCASTIVAARFHLTTQNMNRKMTNGYT